MTIFLDSSLIWFVGLALYYLILKRETFFRLNRYYLILILILGCTVPFISFEFIDKYLFPHGQFGNLLFVNEIREVVIQNSNDKVYFENLENFFLWTYFLGVFFMILKYILNYRALISLVKNATPSDAHPNVYFIPGISNVFSTYNRIFMTSDISQNENIDVIISHEKAHIEQKHILDNILVISTQIFFWFNPLIYFLRKEIKINHEFEADAIAIQNSNLKPSSYGILLIEQINNKFNAKLFPNFSSSPIKDRLKMITKKESKQWLKIKYAFSFIMILFIISQISTNSFAKKRIPKDIANKSITDKSSPESNKIRTSAFFPGCEMSTESEKEQCSNRKLLNYIYNHIEYPQSAITRNREGIVIISFIINTQGYIEDAQVFNNADEDLAQAVLNVIELMKTENIRWEPATVDEIPVNIDMKLPVKFKLQ